MKDVEIKNGEQEYTRVKISRRWGHSIVIPLTGLIEENRNYSVKKRGKKIIIEDIEDMIGEVDRIDEVEMKKLELEKEMASIREEERGLKIRRDEISRKWGYNVEEILK